MEIVPVVSILFVFILVIGVWNGSMLAENQNILDHSPLNLSPNVINQTVNQTQNQFNQSLNTTSNPVILTVPTTQTTLRTGPTPRITRLKPFLVLKLPCVTV